MSSFVPGLYYLSLTTTDLETESSTSRRSRSWYLAPKIHRDALLATTAMTPDATLELSIEQLIGALNKKLLIECARVGLAMPPMSRTLVATLTAEVRYQELEGSLEC